MRLASFCGSPATFRPRCALITSTQRLLGRKVPIFQFRHKRKVNPAPVQLGLQLPSPVQESFICVAEINDDNVKSLAVTAFVFSLTFWGMISLIKGSVKDRTTQASFSSTQPPSDLIKTCSKYLLERAFTFKPEADKRKGVMTFEGTVRPSYIIAGLLVTVAASGLWSAGLILNYVLPEALKGAGWQWSSIASIALVPWYWKEATQREQIRLMVEEGDTENILYVKGHRDEIISLEETLKLQRRDPDDDSD